MAIENSDIEDLGAAPKRIQNDEGSVQERDIDEVIKAKNFADQPTAPPYGIRFAKIKPPSALG